MLEYAATDTRYLPELRDLLRQRLIELGRLHWAQEEFELLEEVRWPEAEQPCVAALTIKGARTLSPRELAVFRELYVWRENLAETLDRAPFRIVVNEALFTLARQAPRDADALKKIRGLGREMREKQSSEILAAIRRGVALPDADLPRYSRPHRRRPDPGFEERLERLKAIRNAESERLQLPTGLLAPNWLLESVAHSRPATLSELAQVPGVRKWQVEAVGDRLVG
jgi:ribonuclease D